MPVVEEFLKVSHVKTECTKSVVQFVVQLLYNKVL